MTAEGRKHAHGRFRPILTTIAVMLLLVIGWVGLEVWIAYSLEPSGDIRYAKQFRELNASLHRGTGEDVWPVLVEVGELHEAMLAELQTEDGCPWYESEYGFLPLTDYNYALELAREEYQSSNRAWSEILAELDEARSLAGHAVRQLDVVGITGLLDRVAASSVSIRPVDVHAQDEELVDYSIHGKLRSLARTLHASAARASSRGDWGRYLIAIEQGLAIAKHLESQPVYIDHLVGMAISSLFYDQLRSDLTRGVPADITCEIGDILSRQQGTLTPGDVFRAERLWALHSARGFYSSGGRYVLTEFAESSPYQQSKHWIHNTQSVWMPRWDSVELEINQRYDSFVEFMASPRHERVKAVPYAPPDMMAIVRATNALDYVTLSNETWLLGDVFDRMETVRSGVHLMLAVECFVHENGRYPEHLNRLVPAYFEQLPPDVYSADGRPWVYQLKDNPSRQEMAYTLYSVGLDGVDNGGYILPGTKPGRALNHGVFGDDTTGSDYVVTHMADE